MFLALRILGPIALLAAFWGWGWTMGSTGEKRKATEAILAATQAAREREGQWQADAHTIEEVHDAEIRRIAAGRDAALRELRNRPERLPEVARAACAGATGAELSERDATAFIGLATRADQVRTDLQACRSWLETVTK